MKCIVTTQSRDTGDIFASAIIKKFYNVNDIFIITKNDKLTKEWIENTYNTIYVINCFENFGDKAVYIPSVKDAIEYVKQKNKFIIGDSFLLKDVRDNYLTTNIFKKLSIETAISIAENILDSYIIDKRKIKNVMKLNDSNLMNICFQNGADICYIIDERKQFVIIINRNIDLEFDKNIFDVIKDIVPDPNYLILSKKVISYGTNRFSLPIQIINKCEYNDETIKNIVERWYVYNKK